MGPIHLPKSLEYRKDTFVEMAKGYFGHRKMKP